MTKFRPFKFLSLAFAFSLACGMAPVGCKTQLSPTGVYQGDTALYNAHKTIISSQDALEDFVKWESDNRAALVRYPAITKASDHIRDNARDWRRSAVNLVRVYEDFPTSENKKKLELAVDILKQAVAEAARYKTTRISQ